MFDSERMALNDTLLMDYSNLQEIEIPTAVFAQCGFSESTAIVCVAPGRLW